MRAGVMLLTTRALARGRSRAIYSALKIEDRARGRGDDYAGMSHLGESAQGHALSDYHLTSADRACHATAKDYQLTIGRGFCAYDRLWNLMIRPCRAESSRGTCFPAMSTGKKQDSKP